MSDMNACQPLAECPEQSCGTLDDGCGGVIECEPCRCIDGMPQRSNCGICGLGRASCNGDELLCDEPSIPGADSIDCTEHIIYIDANYMGFESGSRQEPFSNLGGALAQAKDDFDISLIAVREGELNHEPVTWRNGLSMIGGFDDNWAYQPDEKSQIVFTATSDERHRGLRVVNSTRDMVLANLELETEDALEDVLYTTPLEIDASENISLISITTLAGRGGAGRDGADGLDGPGGTAGTDAQMRTEGEIGFMLPGTPGFPNMSCLDAAGGSGGEGGTSANDAEDGRGPVAPGEPANQGQGADGINSFQGQFGGPGRSFNEAAQAGEHASGEAIWEKDSSGSSVWVHDLHGTSGEDGNHGIGGTGGGGGVYRQITESDGQQAFYDGGAGGGGGNGGCGGAGGGGGQGGGSSFGAVIIDSTNISVSSSSFEASNGGNAGDGGIAGTGGTGGRGGRGTRFPTSNAGGRGGDGGRGQDGGDGGSGCGGYSNGIICNVSVDLEDATLTGATPGRGGRGARPGITDAQQGCR